MIKVYRKYKQSTEIRVIVDENLIVPQFVRNGDFFDYSTSDSKIQEALEKHDLFKKVFSLVMKGESEKSNFTSGKFSSNISKLQASISEKETVIEKNQAELIEAQSTIEQLTAELEEKNNLIEMIRKEFSMPDENISEKNEEIKPTSTEMDNTVSEKNIVDSVTTTQEAKAYLRSKGITIENVASLEKVISVGESNDIIFINLK